MKLTQNLVYVQRDHLLEYKEKYPELELVISSDFKEDETLFCLCKDLNCSFVNESGILYIGEGEFPYFFNRFKKLLNEIQSGEEIKRCLEKMIKDLSGEM